MTSVHVQFWTSACACAILDLVCVGMSNTPMNYVWNVWMAPLGIIQSADFLNKLAILELACMGCRNVWLTCNDSFHFHLHHVDSPTVASHV